MSSVWIESRKRGWYRVRWREDGKPKASEVYTDKSKAEDRRRLVLNFLRAREPLAPSRRAGALPFGEVVQRWSRSKVADGMTQEHADQVVAMLTKLAAERDWQTTRDVTAEAIDAWKVARNGRGVARPYAYLRGVLRWAKRTQGQPIWDDAASLEMKTPRRKPLEDLLTQAQLDELIVKAATFGPQCAALARYLSTYGARPRTAFKLRVGDVDLQRGTLTIRVKGGDTARHPLFPETVADFRAIIGGRDPSEPLFLSHLKGERGPLPWIGSGAMTSWWYCLVGRDLIDADDKPRLPAPLWGIYNLKRFAISRMVKGEKPWARPLTVAEVKLFTAHRSDSQVLRYMRTNEEDARAVMGIATGFAEPKRRRTAHTGHTQPVSAGKRKTPKPLSA